MLHLGVHFLISSMHPNESSECNYVRLLFIFYLHLHPGGLVNKMTKIYFFMFRRKNNIFTVLAENIFAVFEEICVFGEKV